MSTQATTPGKGLRGLDIFLGMICIIFFVDTVAPMAAMGVTAITWAIIIAIIFYIPSGMLTAELATTYPEDGGMYAWVKRAYGNRWGARISYLYWVNNAIWTASVATFFVGVFSFLFFPNIPFIAMLALMLVCIWLIILISMRSVEEAKWINNATTIVKLVLAVSLVVSAIIFLVQKGASASTFSWEQMKPSLSQSLTFMPALIYNFLGFEAVMTLTTHMKNPQRDIPRITIASSVLVASIYIITSIALLIIIPAGDINLVTGIMDAFFTVLSGSTIGRVVIYIIGILFLLTILVQTSTYLTAACRMAAAASDDGELPKIFGKRHKKHDTPVGGLWIMGAVGTVLVVTYGLMANTAEDLFWTFFSFVSVIYLFTFIINYQGYTKLQKIDTETVRPFHFPGPKILARFFAHLCQIILIITIVLFFWVPGYGIDWNYSIPLAIGIVISLIIGEILTYTALKNKKKTQAQASIKQNQLTDIEEGVDLK